MPQPPDLFLPTPADQTLPAVNQSPAATVPTLADQITEACHAWLLKSPSRDTRSNYERDIRQFLAFAGVPADRPQELAAVLSSQVSAWRDHLQSRGLTNSTVLRKITALRSLFSYLQTFGLVETNPAHSNRVAAPAVPRDGKTVALSPDDCRRLLNAPAVKVKKKNSAEEIPQPAGIRDRAIFAILAFTGCRVGELTRMKVGSYKQNGVHKVLEIHGKGGKERLVPLQHEAAEKLEAWLDAAGIRNELNGPLFRPVNAARGGGRTGFAHAAITRRAVQKLVERYVRLLDLDPHVSVHSLRVTALTNGRERGSDIIDLQDFAGHADPRTTLTYIRSRDRLSQSPAYVLKY
jgi:integrase/recombinase XerD